VEGQPVALGDLAGAVGQQGQVAVIQLRNQGLQHVDGFLDIRADQPGGAALPHGQLDQLGVEQGEPHRGIQRADRHQELEDVGLASTRLPAQQEVALGQGDRDRATVLVLPDRDRLPQRQRPRVDQRPGRRGRVGQRIAA
jgi:hypothetical protein